MIHSTTHTTIRDVDISCTCLECSRRGNTMMLMMMNYDDADDDEYDDADDDEIR